MPHTAPLIKMVQKIMWVEKEGNASRPSVMHAMDGLSPFFMLDLSEDEVASINDEADLLNQASLVSVKDLRLLKKRMKISVPESAEEFMLVLKRYANLLFVIFIPRCPLFKCGKEIILVLKDYSREARRKISVHTKGSILWIILLKSRQFGMGEVNILYEVTSMHEDLWAKKLSIHYSEMPSELMQNSLG